MRIYTYKHLYKPGKVITSLRKNQERNISFVTIISPIWLKKQKSISETNYPKIDITENMCDYTVKYWQLSINLCQFFSFFACYR